LGTPSNSPVVHGLGQQPFSTGAPLGITVGPDRTLCYADIGIVAGSSGIGPGNHTGALRRITFTGGMPNPPETIADNLQFPANEIGRLTHGRSTIDFRGARSAPRV
jgi:hypothetical protein